MGHKEGLFIAYFSTRGMAFFIFGGLTRTRGCMGVR
jgi:hypothetical protein